MQDRVTRLFLFLMYGTYYGRLKSEFKSYFKKRKFGQFLIRIRNLLQAGAKPDPQHW